LRISRYFAAALSVLSLTLGGCGIINNEGSPYVCPNTAILEGPGELVRFTAGSASAPNDVSFRTKMKMVSGTCDVDEKNISMELYIAMETLRGPANTKGEAQFAYFVAILDKDKKILTRTKFPMIAKFKRDETKLEFTEPVTVTIPRKKNTLPEDYMVYMGFEMTPEELAYNRNRQRLP
jgi:hypothetical protein